MTPLEWGVPGVHAIGRRVCQYPSLESTSDVARTLAADPANHGTAVIADFQTRGRGQYGRVWQASPGSSLLMSVVLHPPAELARPLVMTALAAVSVARVLTKLDVEGVRIKWPNDVLVADRKICGILIECGNVPEGRLGVVMGVGLNLAQSAEQLAEGGLPDATSLRIATRRTAPPAEVAALLLNTLDDGYRELLGVGTGKLLESFSDGLGLRGKPVRLTLQPDQSAEGVLRDITLQAVICEMADGSIAEWPPERVRGMVELPE